MHLRRPLAGFDAPFLQFGEVARTPSVGRHARREQCLQELLGRRVEGRTVVEDHCCGAEHGAQGDVPEGPADAGVVEVDIFGGEVVVEVVFFYAVDEEALDVWVSGGGRA